MFPRCFGLHGPQDQEILRSTHVSPRKETEDRDRAGADMHDIPEEGWGVFHMACPSSSTRQQSHVRREGESVDWRLKLSYVKRLQITMVCTQQEDEEDEDDEKESQCGEARATFDNMAFRQSWLTSERGCQRTCSASCSCCLRRMCWRQTTARAPLPPAM